MFFVIFAIIALGTFIATSISAEGTIVNVENKNAYRGETVTFNATISESVEVGSGALSLSYDSSVLELTGGSCNVNGAMLSHFDVSKGKGAFAFSGTGIVSGNLFSVTFRVKDTATFGTTNVSLIVTLKDGSNQVFPLTNNSGSVTVQCKHIFTKEDLLYLKSEASCTAPAIYYKSCITCGAKGTDTFEYGSTKPHSYTEIVLEVYMKIPASCTSKAVYYKSCSVCGMKGTEIFEYGDFAAHTYKTAWSTDSAKHWHECSVCGAKKDEAAHTPGAVATETTPQTCTACGYVIKAALGHTHNFNQKNTSETYLKSSATCTKKAVYYYSCTCGEKGMETFESGETAPHSYLTEWSSDGTNHWHKCANCDAIADKAAHADTNKDHNCDACGKKMTDHTGGTATCKEKATCTICGQKYGELAAHNYKAEWSKDKNKHWHECSVCGNKKDEAAHTPGAAATETKPQVCTVCNYEITPATGHTHSFNRKSTDAKYLKSAATCTKKAVYYYSCTCGVTGTTTFESGDLAAHIYKTEWSKDSAKHWHECSVCGNKKDEAAHTPGAAATETTPQTCTACGYVIKEATGHVHSYTEKNTDAKYLKSAATCTAKAVYYYSCSCGEKGTETFESGETLAHTWETKWANNDSKHWHECTVCKTKGDEADHAFEWKIDKESTVTEAGAKHEECKVCGYKKATVSIDKLAPSIIDGRNVKWNKGGENNLTFKSDAAFSDFVEVLVDGKVITAENYEKREGSIIIQLKASYLATLAEGEHTLTIRSASGDATTKFTVEAEIVSPPTGSTNVWVWIIIGVAILSVCTIAFVFVIRKKRM